ncbi:MAG TPA: hypothetical protein VF720_07365 [Candidatus Eisenbacteria bacterium]
MTRKLIAIVMVGAAIAAGTIGIATSREPALAVPGAATPAGDAEAARTPQPIDPEHLTPMHREIQAYLQEERLQVEALTGRLAAASTEERLTLHLQIEQAKKAGQRGVFEIQLRHARAAGNIESVQQLESVLAHIDRPEPALDGPTLLEQVQRGLLPAAGSTR